MSSRFFLSTLSVAFLVQAGVCFAGSEQTASEDFFGSQSQLQKQINVKIAENNAQQTEINQQLLKSIGQIPTGLPGQALPGLSNIGTFQPNLTGTGLSPVSSSGIHTSLKPGGTFVNAPLEGKTAKEKVEALQKRMDEQMSKISELDKLSPLTEEKKQELFQVVAAYKQDQSTYQEINKKHPELAGDWKNEVRYYAPNTTVMFDDEIPMPAADASIVNEVVSLASQASTASVSGSLIASGSLQPGSQSTRIADLSPIDQIRMACTKNFGGVDGGPALVSHLSKGGCKEALEKNPEIAKSFGIHSLLGSLGKLQSLLGGLARNSLMFKGLNVRSLADLGIIVFPNLSQASVPQAADPAVAIQQSQQAALQIAAQKEPVAKPVKTDKPVINASSLTD